MSYIYMQLLSYYLIAVDCSKVECSKSLMLIFILFNKIKTHPNTALLITWILSIYFRSKCWYWWTIKKWWFWYHVCFPWNFSWGQELEIDYPTVQCIPSGDWWIPHCNWMVSTSVLNLSQMYTTYMYLQYMTLQTSK